MRALAGLGLILIAAACAPQPRADACGAAGLSNLVGQPATAARGLAVAAPVRILEADTPRTDDYRPDRLNIDVGAGGLITSVWCG